jgi:hypothetical protein
VLTGTMAAWLPLALSSGGGRTHVHSPSFGSTAGVRSGGGNGGTPHQWLPTATTRALTGRMSPVDLPLCG